MLCQSLGPTLWCVFFPDSCTLEMQLYIEEADSELQALLPPTSALWNLALRLANTEVRPQAEYISLASLELRILHLPCLARHQARKARWKQLYEGICDGNQQTCRSACDL